MTRSNNSMQGFEGLKSLQGNLPSKSNNTTSNHKKMMDINSGDENTKEQSCTVKLTRSITVKRYPIIATVCLLEERTDIVNLLTQAKQNTSNLPNRLKEYLQKEALLDTQLQLTDKADQVISTGKIPILERGLYHIWYSEDDSLLGTRALVIQRDEAFNKEPKYNVIRKGSAAEHSPFSLMKTTTLPLIAKFAASKESSNLQLKSQDIISIKPEVLCSATDSKKITLRWDISLTNSTFTLEGALNILSGRNHDQIAPVKYQLKGDDFSEHTTAIFQMLTNELDGTWQEHSKKARLPYQLTHQYPEMVTKFQLNHYNIKNIKTDLGYFDDVSITNLPVQPILGDENLWHHAWLEQYYNNGYIEVDKAQKAQLNWLEQPALKQYNLQPLLANELIEALSIEKNAQAYWQCAAMHDLTPSSLNETQTSFTLANGDKISISQLLQRLSFNNQITHFLFSDRFIINKRQQSLLTTFCQSFEPQDITILTLEESKGSLSPKWNLELFKKHRHNHDRYWIFKSDYSLLAWKCSTSFDFLKSSDESFIVEGYPTFTPVNENDLPSYLIKKLEEICVTEPA